MLMRNAGLRFICRTVALQVETSHSAFTMGYEKGAVVDFPIAHHDGNYRASRETLERLAGEDRIAFRYRENPNGSAEDIAGILSENRRILGLMPHPERCVDYGHGGTDGSNLFDGVARTFAESAMSRA